MTPPACSWRQGLDVSSFPSKNMILDLNLGLVQGQPFVSCVPGQGEFLWFTHLENENKNVPIPWSSCDLKALGTY